MKKIFTILTVLLVSLSMFSTSVFAKENGGKESLVALGDSIPYGFNLENNNHHPSREAYPYLIGDEADLRVRNLSVPGWKTDDLLTAIMNDQKYRQAIKHADYITLSIGSNDLLKEFGSSEVQGKIMQFIASPNPLLFAEIQEALEVEELVESMEEIVLEIQSLTDAPIVVYNIYNPYAYDSPYFRAGNLLLNDFAGIPSINSMIENDLSEQDVTVVDAFTAMFGNDDNLIDNDIHPSFMGQQELAKVGYEAIMDFE
ncbi:lysophospholipase L1-like esterase [Salirhabdus euzebyi]|uniref:Lysophospholipase L1-like esterase n=1 Tax=Salirhabdus euzebyi TaxID=394506 RepID=A0A841Q7Z0_9BACI|nr:GDSL-type esterase/lipase family protein [Salirhabdus euzebyi]MBB6454561.1 lysophospholipase L1-like esterase [Salirhabdus euzebyi]